MSLVSVSLSNPHWSRIDQGNLLERRFPYLLSPVLSHRNVRRHDVFAVSAAEGEETERGIHVKFQLVVLDLKIGLLVRLCHCSIQLLRPQRQFNSRPTLLIHRARWVNFETTPFQRHPHVGHRRWSLPTHVHHRRINTWRNLFPVRTWFLRCRVSFRSLLLARRYLVRNFLDVHQIFPLPRRLLLHRRPRHRPWRRVRKAMMTTIRCPNGLKIVFIAPLFSDWNLFSSKIFLRHQHHHRWNLPRALVRSIVRTCQKSPMKYNRILSLIITLKSDEVFPFLIISRFNPSNKRSPSKARRRPTISVFRLSTNWRIVSISISKN